LLGIHDPEALARIEYEHTLELSAYLIDHPITITSCEQLIEIHRYLFQAIYPWAGEIRTYDIRKGTVGFMPYTHMDEGITFINTTLGNLPDSPLKRVDYATLLDAVNYLHPFREGNGRSTRLFLQLLALQHGQFLDYPRHLPELVQAENDANIQALADLLTVNDGPNTAERWTSHVY
jgi:cell filamentation protein